MRTEILIRDFSFKLRKLNRLQLQILAFIIWQPNETVQLRAIVEKFPQFGSKTIEWCVGELEKLQCPVIVDGAGTSLEYTVYTEWNRTTNDSIVSISPILRGSIDEALRLL